jgi:hypothetical protein
MPASGIWLVSFPVSGVDEVLKARGRAQGARKALAYAEPDYVVTANAVPNDPGFSELWGLRNTGQPTNDDFRVPGVVGMDIRATGAWATEADTGSLDVKVGVIDTGIDYTHPDLVENIWVNPNEIPDNGIDDDGNSYVDDVRGWNFVNNTNNAMDVEGHGTHVAGTIGARGNNSVGVAGVCWRVSLVPLKFLGPDAGDLSDAVEAVAYATSIGVHLTNNSWGGGGYSQALKDVIDAANAAGILFVAAAGNEGADNDVSPSYPDSYACPNIISVAATDRFGALGFFSNYGRSMVDVGAPGVAIYSTVPDGYGFLDGTSMAAPHVAGLCALLKSRKPTLTHLQIRDCVLSTARPLQSLTGKTVTGGLIDAEAAVNAGLVVSYPSSSFSGQPGGPFTPSSATFTVTNAGAVPEVWSVAVDELPVWLDLSISGGALAAGASAEVTVSPNSQAATLRWGVDRAELRFLNTANEEVAVRTVELLRGGPEYFTELFSSADNDTDNQSFAFLPQDSASGYTVRRSNVASFPVDPAGGTRLAIPDDGSARVDLVGGKQVQLYGTAYSSFYVGSNGYITFTQSDERSSPSFDTHFELPRVSALMADLNPEAGGEVSWKQMPDRAVVTWSGVPTYVDPESNSLESDSNSFQIELFFDGRIRITLLDLGNSGGLIGLSFGGGTPSNLVESDFAAYPLSQPPTVSAIPNQSINEGTATGELSFTVGSSDTSAGALTVTATASNSALVPADGLILGGTGANRTLKVVPSPSGLGSTQILVTVADAFGSSATTSFTLTVNAQAPLINPPANVRLIEGGPIAPVVLTGIRSGNPVAPLPLSVTAASNRTDLLPNPVVQYTTGGTEATLLLNPTFADAGVAVVTVTVSDGRPENGTTTAIFQVETRLRNFAPSFRGGGDQSVLEDSSLQRIPQWATEISAGRGRESGQALSFELTHDAPGLFSVQPTLSSDGTLTYQAAPDAWGTATVQVRLRDNGGTNDGGVDTSAPHTLRITVSPVNDAPSFERGANVNVPLGTGAHTVPGWASAVRAGPANESSQGLSFVVEAVDKSLFSVQPAVSSTGTLTFTPAPKLSGDTLVSISLKDTGGTERGGSDTSSTAQFKIAITTSANQFGEFNGLIQPLVLPADSTQHLGLVKMNVARGGAFSGNLKLGTVNYPIRGKFDDSGIARFGKANDSKLTILRKRLPSLVVELQVDVINSTGKLVGAIAEGATPVASLVADRFLYSAAKAPKSPYRSVPSDLLGAFTVGFAPPEGADLYTAASGWHYQNGFTVAHDRAVLMSVPRGHGIGVFRVSTSGKATLVGKLADGSAVSYSNAVSIGKKFPVYHTYSLPKGAVGTLAGWVTLDNPTEQDDFEATLRWFRPATVSPTYPAGWPTGIPLQMQGSRWLSQAQTGQVVRFPGLTPANRNGNVLFTFSEGLLPGTGFETPANVSNKNAITPVAGLNRQSLRSNSIGGTGLFSGGFTHPSTGRKPRFDAVILQKRKRAVGFFLTPEASGAVRVEPR